MGEAPKGLQEGFWTCFATGCDGWTSAPSARRLSRLRYLACNFVNYSVCLNFRKSSTIRQKMTRPEGQKVHLGNYVLGTPRKKICIFNINANLYLFTTNKIQPLLELSIRRLAFDPGPTSASTSCRRFRSPSGSWLWWQWLSGNRIALKSRGRDSTSWVCPVKMVVPCGAYTYFKSLYDPHTYGLCWSNFDPYTPGLQIGQGIQIASGTLLAATCHRSKLATRTWETCFCKKYLQNIPEGPGLILTYFDHITNSKLGKCRSRSRFRASRAAFSWSRKAFKKNK